MRRTRNYYRDKLEAWSCNDLTPTNPDLYDLIVDMRSSRISWEEIARLLAPHWKGEVQALKSMLTETISRPVSEVEKKAIANSRLDDLVEILAPLLENTDDPVRTANAIMRVEEIRSKINNTGPSVVINNVGQARDLLPELLELVQVEPEE